MDITPGTSALVTGANGGLGQPIACARATGGDRVAQKVIAAQAHER